MFKFLRKYNKWILAVGGTLLMIVFLAPQAIQTLSQQAALGGAAWATVGTSDTEVPAEVRRECEQELQVIETLSRAAPSLAITDRPEHWYLLVREADEAGLLGGRASDLLSEDQMNLLFQVAGRSALVDEALGKRMAIDRLMLMYQGAAKLSDLRLRKEAERLFHGVDARLVVIDADPEADVAEPTAAMLNEQFETYRDVNPNDPTEEEGTPAFGYRLPDRLKLEWLRIDAGAVRSMVEESFGQDGVLIFKHWQRFAAVRNFPEVDTTGDIPEVVREDFLQEKTAETLAAIEKFANDQLLASVRRLRMDGGYYMVPETWSDTRVSFTALAQSTQAEFPGLVLPAYEAIGDRWLTLGDLAEIESIADAQTDRLGSRVVRIQELASTLQEFGAASPVALTQVGIAGPLLRDRNDESIVIYRVTAADPARPPRDLDEVREEVTADLKRKAHYAELRACAESLEATARSEGLLSVALENDRDLEPVTRVKLDDARLLAFAIQNNIQIPRASDLPIIGTHRPTIEAIVDRAIALPLETPVAERSAEERIFVLPVDEKMALLVVELTGQFPIDKETFDDLVRSGGLQGLLISEELADAGDNVSVREVFGYDALAERHNFQLKTRATTAPDADPDADADADADAATETAAASTE